MSKREIAHKYLEYLEKGDINSVINLFHEKGNVDSPIYGIKKADEFYRELRSDTTNSKLQLLGIYEEKDSNSLALYFTYIWTLKNSEKVEICILLIKTIK